MGFYYRQVEPVWCSRQAIHSLSWSSPIKDRNPCVSGVRTQTTTQKWTRPLLTRPCCSMNIHYSYYLERNALGIDNVIRFCSILLIGKCRQVVDLLYFTFTKDPRLSPRELDDVWAIWMICPPVEDAIVSKRLNPLDPRRILPVNILRNQIHIHNIFSYCQYMWKYVVFYQSYELKYSDLG